MPTIEQIRNDGRAIMKLVRLDGNRTGLLVELASGLHVIDVVASLGALGPSDPISCGILNGLLKDHGSWSALIQHWSVARIGLLRIAATARSHPASVKLQPFESDAAFRCPDGIRSIDIEEGEVALASGRDDTLAAVPEAPAFGTADRDDKVILLSTFRSA